jgi:hypothetical protein
VAVASVRLVRCLRVPRFLVLAGLCLLGVTAVTMLVGSTRGVTVLLGLLLPVMTFRLRLFA